MFSRTITSFSKGPEGRGADMSSEQSAFGLQASCCYRSPQRSSSGSLKLLTCTPNSGPPSTWKQRGGVFVLSLEAEVA